MKPNVLDSAVVAVLHCCTDLRVRRSGQTLRGPARRFFVGWRRADLGVGVIPWSPLARGRLTRDWDEETTRSQTDEFGSNLYRPGDRVIVEQVARIASERQVPRAQVGLAWVASRPGITAPIIGATKPQHISEAVAALDLVLTDAEFQQLETAYEPHDPAGFRPAPST